MIQGCFNFRVLREDLSGVVNHKNSAGLDEPRYRCAQKGTCHSLVGTSTCHTIRG